MRTQPGAVDFSCTCTSHAHHSGFPPPRTRHKRGRRNAENMVFSAPIPGPSLPLSREAIDLRAALQSTHRPAVKVLRRNRRPRVSGRIPSELDAHDSAARTLPLSPRLGTFHEGDDRLAPLFSQGGKDEKRQRVCGSTWILIDRDAERETHRLAKSRPHAGGVARVSSAGRHNYGAALFDVAGPAVPFRRR